MANRGFNLLAAALLGIGGLLFGSVLLQESDLADKLDDGAFLLVAVTAVLWYSWPERRFRRSAVPTAIATFAVLVQVLGLVLERDDPRAFGDNIGGVLYFGASLVTIAVQFRRTKDLFGA